jgi:integrase
MNRARRGLPLQHRLVPVFDRAVDSLSAALSPETTRHHRGTAHHFLSYLGAAHPEVSSLDQLRREPHILAWMTRLRSQGPPLSTASYFNRLIALRSILNELAWTEQLSDLTHLIRRQDIPRVPQRLPRPLTTEQDQLLQQEFRGRNDLGGNTFLLIRHTGMRIGECADLSFGRSSFRPRLLRPIRRTIQMARKPNAGNAFTRSPSWVTLMTNGAKSVPSVRKIGPNIQHHTA